MDVVEMDMGEVLDDVEEEEEEVEICTLVALNLDTGVEVSFDTKSGKFTFFHSTLNAIQDLQMQKPPGMVGVFGH